jgi:hypothetical protein
MNTIRHLALQLELSRIEAQGAAHTQAIINRAADLEAAYDLCLTVSVGLPEREAFRPTVTYDDEDGVCTGCQINVMPLERGAEFLERATDAGLTFAPAGHPYGALRDLEFTGFPRVHVLIPERELDDYQRQAWRARAAAKAA